MTTAYLLDLEGTLYTDRGVVPGGPEAIAALRARGVPFRCVTNTTTRSRAALAARLAGFGYDIPASDILTPVGAAIAHCGAHGLTRVAAYLPQAALEDLTGLDLVPAGGAGGHGPARTPAAILIGDLGEAWTFSVMQEAFAHVMAGAEIVALSRDRYFLRDGRLTLDAGAFVAGLEYATGRTATVVGKPSATFFEMARAALSGTDEVVMVGDDLWSDIQGAQRCGLVAWLVRTGKFREDTLRESGVRPDRIVDSVVDLVRSEK
jgi:HAD superfamily hydrolase (TIGR01458 family)